VGLFQAKLYFGNEFLLKRKILLSAEDNGSERKFLGAAQRLFDGLAEVKKLQCFTAIGPDTDRKESFLHRDTPKKATESL
jgi:hypothetical protein